MAAIYTCGDCSRVFVLKSKYLRHKVEYGHDKNRS